MDNVVNIGMVVVGFSTLVSLYINVHNLKKDNDEPIKELNKNFVETIKQITILNEQLKASNQRADNHDERITQHGREIDELKDRVNKHEMELNYLKK